MKANKKRKKRLVGPPLELGIWGVAELSMPGGAHGVVQFHLAEIDGCSPTTGEVYGDDKLIDDARYSRRVTLGLLGGTVSIRILGHNKQTGALIIDSRPLMPRLRSRTLAAEQS